jgi:RNA polymerase sigma-70 factor (ECF subfamily)
MPALRRQAARRVPSDAVDDIVQETLLAALESLPGYRGEAAPQTWLAHIMRFKIADFYRRRRAVVDVEDIEETCVDSIDSEEARLLRVLLWSLKPDYTRLLWLRFFAGFKFEECAEILGISLDATKSRYRRAIIALTREWQA